MGRILQSSQTLKKNLKSTKSYLKEGISKSRILLIWVWAAGLQGQNGKKGIKTRQNRGKKRPN
jgi:hypothetical protein